MTEHIRLSKKSGLPPGSLVHIGKKITEKPFFYWSQYSKSKINQGTTSLVSDLPLPSDSDITWVDMVGINHIETVEELGKNYNLHPLVLEDIVNTEQRPKFEEFDGYTFLTLKKIEYTKSFTAVYQTQVSLVFGKNFVITFREEDSNIFEDIRKRLLSGASKARHKKSDYLVYHVLDSIVDSYFEIIEKLSDDIEVVEDRMIREVKGLSMAPFQRLRRNLVFMLKSLYPLREALSRLEKRDNPQLDPENIPYFRDVYDHTLHIIESIENQREILSGVMDIYLSNLNNRMNSIMKVLTIIATIFIPISFFASVYGMNFENFPEIHYKYGYLYFWILILVIVVIMLLYFRKKKWL
ncbi:MAG: magnesium/cobalt transporter CorA [Bacteroidales bacterium]